MVERLTLHLTTEERKALQIAAEAEVRDIREQARFFVRLELERRGLLAPQEAEQKIIGNLICAGVK